MSLVIPTQPWWETDSYTVEDGLHEFLKDPAISGPKGIALVRAYADGQTQKGWGLTAKEGDAFIPRYERGEFLSNRALYGYNQGKHGFAIVMRSTRLICVDIDGKNGGLEHAQNLGNLPYTLAERSKSGNGYHLFYEYEDEWDSDAGFDLLPDQIGVTQGVDIRAVGCVYHYNTQRWNNRSISLLPEWLKDKMQERQMKRLAAAARITHTINTQDEMEILVMHAELLEELAKPIAQGKRNTTLFAIGNKLKQAAYPEWEQAVSDRASEVGLDLGEAEQIVANIGRYGD